MKTTILAVLALALLVQSRAQTFSVVHNFTEYTGAMGPHGGVVLYNGVLYGTTYGLGTNGEGSIFKMNQDGSGYRVLKSFSPEGGAPEDGANTDGARPMTDLTVSGNMIYGTAYAGGSFGNGTIYSLTTNGADFTVLKEFPDDSLGYPTQGAHPASRLILVGNLLYGTVGNGTGGLFSMSTNGTGFTLIYGMGAPAGDLILQGDTFYGINSQTIFSIKTNGTDFFPIANYTTNGLSPSCLTLSGSTLYGVCYGNDVLFRVNTDGSDFQILRTLTASDGTWPTSSLVLYSNTLYGTTYMQGPAAFGTLYQINTDGSGFAVTKAFSGNSGQFPQGNLMLSGHTLYGTTDQGGTNNSGVVFAMDVMPIVAHISYSKHLLDLKWNTLSNHVYQLQFTTNLISGGWQNLGTSVTAKSNSISAAVAPGGGTQQFYRINLVQ